jgi:cytoskeletal protein RodZ
MLLADQSACLCIVARDRLRGSDFVAALEASLRPDEQLEIIVDRRSAEPSGEWERSADRRRRPQVDLALKANGFAVIPAPISKSERHALSMLPLSASSSRPASDDYDEDDDEEHLEAIRSFKRERSGHLVPWIVATLAVVVVAVAAFVWSPTGQAFTQSLVQRTAPETPGPASQPTQTSASDAPTSTPSPAVAEKPTGVAEAPPRPPANEAPPVEQSTRAATPPATPEAPPSQSRIAASPSNARTPSVESSAPPSAATGSRSRAADTARPTSPEPAPRQVAVAPPPGQPMSRAVSPRFAGLPRIELSREPGTPAGTYAVKVLDPAGKPLGDAEVLLLARMPDGTVENVRMDFSSDQGTYRGALAARSAPVDLRVRVITGDKRLEIPLGP